MPSNRLLRHTIVAIAVLSARPVEGQQVSVRASEEGQAILRAAAGQCYALTPRHVVENATDILLTDAEGKTASPGSPDTMDSLAIMQIPLERDGIRCPRSRRDTRDLTGLLRRGSPAFFTIFRPGSRLRSNMHVDVVDWNDFKIFVTPRDPAYQIQKGMSGSPLIDRETGRTLGILLNVVEEDGRSSGEVLRLDHVDRVTGSYFRTARPLAARSAGFYGVAYDAYPGTRMWGITGHSGRILSRDLALVGSLQFARSQDNRLQNSAQNDTATSTSGSLGAGLRLWLLHGDRWLAAYVQAGGIGRFESKAAYDSIFGDYTAVGGTGSAGIGVAVGRNLLSLEVEAQTLWVTPQRERNITTRPNREDALILRLGITRFWGSAR